MLITFIFLLIPSTPGIKQQIPLTIILIFTPTYYVLTFSGLTEPLFALILIIGTYLCAKEKHASASILISFLPFVRSEGLIILGVFGFYFIIVLKKEL